MEKMIDLKDLLKHEILDLYSAEEQIIAALPAMIEKANNGSLKNALQEHLKITEKQKTRLDEIKQIMAGDEGAAETAASPENTDGAEKAEGSGGAESDEATKAAEAPKKPGFFSRLFSGGEKCKGMEGLITEGNKMMGEDMSPEVLDAAIIASAQKIEHYEISGYGTARAYARELNLDDVANKLTETLNEEYEADDRLTQLAVGKLNVAAEKADGSEKSKPGRQSFAGKSASKGSPKSSPAKGPAKGSPSKNSPSKSVSKSSPAKNSSSKSSSSKSSKAAPSKSTKGSPSKGFSKSSPSKSSLKSSSKKLPSKGSSAKGSSSKSASKSSSKSSPAKGPLKVSLSKSASKSTSKGSNSKASGGSSKSATKGSAASKSSAKKGSSPRKR